MFGGLSGEEGKHSCRLVEGPRRVRDGALHPGDARQAARSECVRHQPAGECRRVGDRAHRQDHRRAHQGQTARARGEEGRGTRGCNRDRRRGQRAGDSRAPQDRRARPQSGDDAARRTRRKLPRSTATDQTHRRGHRRGRAQSGPGSGCAHVAPVHGFARRRVEGRRGRRQDARGDRARGVQPGRRQGRQPEPVDR